MRTQDGRMRLLSPQNGAVLESHVFVNYNMKNVFAVILAATAALRDSSTGNTSSILLLSMMLMMMLDPGHSVFGSRHRWTRLWFISNLLTPTSGDERSDGNIARHQDLSPW